MGLIPIDRKDVEVGMFIIWINDCAIMLGKILETGDVLKMRRCGDVVASADLIHRMYFYPQCIAAVDGLYVCPAEIADRMWFRDDLPATVMEIIS